MISHQWLIWSSVFMAPTSSPTIALHVTSSEDAGKIVDTWVYFRCHQLPISRDMHSIMGQAWIMGVLRNMYIRTSAHWNQSHFIVEGDNIFTVIRFFYLMPYRLSVSPGKLNPANHRFPAAVFCSSFIYYLFSLLIVSIRVITCTSHLIGVTYCKDWQ